MPQEGARQGGKPIVSQTDAHKGAVGPVVKVEPDDKVGPVVKVYSDEPTDPAQGSGPSIQPGRYADSPPDESGRHRRS